MTKDFTRWSVEVSYIQKELLDYEMLLIALLGEPENEEDIIAETEYYLRLVQRHLENLEVLFEGIYGHQDELEEVENDLDAIKTQYYDDHDILGKGVAKERFIFDSFKQKVSLFLDDVVKTLPVEVHV